MTVSRPALLLLAPIRFYQRFVSPALPATCRYYPSCSSYAVEALTTRGAFRGSWLTLRRLGRCHPWHQGGYDPVPPVGERTGQAESWVQVNVVAGRSAFGQDVAANSAVLTPDARPATAETPIPRSHAA